MKRLLLNGSPRGKSSNSRLILSWMAEGMSQAGAGADIPILDLARQSELGAQVAAFLDADEIVLAFPLYTDSVPGLVKNFLEALATQGSARLKGKRVAFVVQSGFPEAIHSQNTAAWLSRLCSRLGMIHGGTAIRGNSEGLRLMPPQMIAKARRDFIGFGADLASSGSFSLERSAKVAGPSRLPQATLGLMRFMEVLGIGNLYWDAMLKKNKAYDRRFDAPYGEAVDTRLA